jgi:hypothetical protein
LKYQTKDRSEHPQSGAPIDEIVRNEEFPQAIMNSLIRCCGGSSLWFQAIIFSLNIFVCGSLRSSAVILFFPPVSWILTPAFKIRNPCPPPARSCLAVANGRNSKSELPPTSRPKPSEEPLLPPGRRPYRPEANFQPFALCIFATDD